LNATKKLIRSKRPRAYLIRHSLTLSAKPLDDIRIIRSDRVVNPESPPVSYSPFFTSCDSTLGIGDSSLHNVLMLSSLMLEHHALQEVDEPLITAECVPLSIYRDESQ
jgi:hypothetical protein